jgi:hypothetical protein
MCSVPSISQRVPCSNQTDTRPKKNTTPFETVRNVLVGTAAGVAARFLGMPLEVVFTKRSFHECTKSYRQLFRENVFNWEALRHLQTEIFTRTCFRPAVYKSFSNFGVITLVESTWPDLSSSKRGGLVIALSTLLETITTTPGEWNKTISMEGKEKKKGMFNAFRIKSLLDPKYHRCLRATFIRSAWSTVFTYGGVYGLESCIKTLYPQKEYNTSAKVVSAVFGPMLFQCFIMPGVNLQTYVFRNPDLPWAESIKQCLKDYKVEKVTDVYKLTKGFGVRTIHRGGTYGLAFLVAEMVKAKE